MTITEFLEARITEDRVTAELRGWHATDCQHLPQDESGYTYPCDCGVSERLAAECAAKRYLIDLDAESYGDQACILAALAAVYKDHPDYRQEWAL